jgi:hypothetical protein
MNFKTIITINKSLQKYVPIELLLQIVFFINDPFLLVFFKQKRHLLQHLKIYPQYTSAKIKSINQTFTMLIVHHCIKSNNLWLMNILIKSCLVNKSVFYFAIKEQKFEIIDLIMKIVIKSTKISKKVQIIELLKTASLIILQVQIMWMSLNLVLFY